MSDEDAGRALFAELVPMAPPDLFDRIDDTLRNWYIDEARRRTS